MKKGKIMLAAALLFSLLGCASQEKPPQDSFRLYYCRTEAAYHQPTGALGYEIAEQDVSQASPQMLLALYLQGPVDRELLPVLPEGCVCRVESLSDGKLVLSLAHAQELTGMKKTLAAAGLTLTMTQHPDVDSVCLQLKGDTLSGDTVYTAEDFLAFDSAAQENEFPASPDRW